MSTNVTKSFNIPASAVVPVYGYAINGFTATSVGQLSILIDGVSTIVPINALGYSAFNINLGSSNQITSINGVAGSLVCTEPVSPVISGGGNSGSDLSSSILAMGLGAQNVNYSNTQKIRSALAKADAGIANVSVLGIGDSTFRGTINGGLAGTGQALAAPFMAAAALLEKQGIPASATNFFGNAVGWGSGNNTIAAWVAGDSRISTSGTVAIGSYDTAGGNPISFSSAGSVTLTPQANVTEYDIYWRDGPTGRNFTWAIDGGATTLISSTNSAFRVVKTTVPAGTAGLHAITIAWAAGGVNINAVVGRNNSGTRKEISFLNCGVPSGSSSRLQENVDAAGTVAMYTAIAPDLTILDGLGMVNDWRQSFPISTTTTNMQSAIDRARLTGDVVYCTPLWYANTDGNSAIQDQYVTADLAVVMANNVPIIDTRAAWISFAAANGLGWYSDLSHPSVLGYAVRAAAYVEFIRRLKAM